MSDTQWTIEQRLNGGYRIRDAEGNEIGVYENARTGQAHHAFALQEVYRLQKFQNNFDLIAGSFNKDVAEEAQRLKLENRALKVDAQRYQWLRSEGLEHINFHKLTPDTCDVGLDAAIDAALKEKQS